MKFIALVSKIMVLGGENLKKFPNFDELFLGDAEVFVNVETRFFSVQLEISRLRGVSWRPKQRTRSQICWDIVTSGAALVLNGLAHFPMKSYQMTSKSQHFQMSVPF